MTHHNEKLYEQLTTLLDKLDKSMSGEAHSVAQLIRDDIESLSICDALEHAMEMSQAIEDAAVRVNELCKDLVKQSKLNTYTVRLSRGRRVEEILTLTIHANSEKEAREDALLQAEAAEDGDWAEDKSDGDGVLIEEIVKLL